MAQNQGQSSFCQTHRLDSLFLSEAEVLFKNFSGEEKKFNAAGQRNFNIAIRDLEQADKLAAMGWKVRRWLPRDAEEEIGLLEVKVRFSDYPPRIYMVKSAGKIELTVETVAMLDHMRITQADLVITPYCWTMPSGASGISAYLSSGYFTIFEDEFDLKYADLDTVGGPLA